MAATIRASTGMGAEAPQRLDLRVLKRPEQLALKGQRHVAHLVQEQGAAVGRLEETGTILAGVRERAPPVTEEQTLEERLGDGGAVDRYEGSFPARAQLMQRTSDQLLSGARLAANEDGTARPLPLGRSG